MKTTSCDISSSSPPSCRVMTYDDVAGGVAKSAISVTSSRVAEAEQDRDGDKDARHQNEARGGTGDNVLLVSRDIGKRKRGAQDNERKRRSHLRDARNGGREGVREFPAGQKHGKAKKDETMYWFLMMFTAISRAFGFPVW